MQRRFLSVLLLGFAVGSAAGCGGDRRPDVVILSIDTLRADRLGCYGYDGALTPEIDRLAREGVRFARCTSPAPITLPSHTSLLSGRTPARHGVRNNGTYRVGDDLPWLPALLQQQGWATGAFVGAFPLSARFGLDRGFDRYDDELHSSDAGAFHLPERSANAVVDAALEWVEDVPAEQPLLLFAHFFEPHAPYAPPADLAARFATQPYDGEVAAADRALGRLREGLKAAGRDDVIFVLVSDHGESLGEHGEETHALTLYEATQRVPFLLHWPGKLPAGTVIETRVGLVDVAPTLLALLGLDPGALEADGRPVDPRHGEPTPTAYPMETLYPYELYRWAPAFAEVRDERKWILSRTRRHFDLSRDPHETTDLASASSDFGVLESWVREEAGGRAASTRTPTEDERAQLAALGYGGGIGGASDAVDGAQWLDRMRALPDVSHRLDDFARMTRAAEQLGEGKASSALETLRPLLEAQEENPWAHTLAGTAYESLGDTDRALAAHEEADRQRPDWLAGKLSLARLHAARGEREDAYLRYGEALALHPGSAVLWVEAAELHLVDDPARSLELLETALSEPRLQGRERAQVEAALASALLRLGQAERGRAHLARALEVDPSSGVRLVAARYALRDEDWETARAHLGAATAADPESAELWFELGELERRTGHPDRAVDAYRRCVARPGASALAHNNLAWLLATEGGDAREAVRHARRAVERQGGVADFHDTLVEALLRAGDDSGAREACLSALGRFPADAALQGRADRHGWR